MPDKHGRRVTDTAPLSVYSEYGINNINQVDCLERALYILKVQDY